MQELGIDISGQESETLDRYLGGPFDYVIIVCDEANETCPILPGAREHLHWSLPDPSRAGGADKERLEVFRALRDRLKSHIDGELANGKGG